MATTLLCGSHTKDIVENIHGIRIHDTAPKFTNRTEPGRSTVSGQSQKVCGLLGGSDRGIVLPALSGNDEIVLGGIDLRPRSGKKRTRYGKFQQWRGFGRVRRDIKKEEIDELLPVPPPVAEGAEESTVVEEAIPILIDQPIPIDLPCQYCPWLPRRSMIFNGLLMTTDKATVQTTDTNTCQNVWRQKVDVGANCCY